MGLLRGTFVLDLIWVWDISHLYGLGYNGSLYPPDSWIQRGSRIKWNTSDHPDTSIVSTAAGSPGTHCIQLCPTDNGNQSHPKLVQSWIEVGPVHSWPKDGRKSVQRWAQSGSQPLLPIDFRTGGGNATCNSVPAPRFELSHANQL